jgi:hypothetical protein
LQKIKVNQKLPDRKVFLSYNQFNRVFLFHPSGEATAHRWAFFIFEFFQKIDIIK